MMQTDSIAFVLKHYAPKKQMVALLDKRYGRLVAHAVHDGLSVGSIIEYRLTQRQGRSFVDHIQVLHMPFELAVHNILFLHHLFEICYHFVPEGSIASRVYDLLLYVVTDPPLCRMRQKKILFLLFTLLGMYPDDVVICREYARALHQDSFDAILTATLDTGIEKYLRGWLYQCVTMHAYGQKFKTLHYLNEK